MWEMEMQAHADFPAFQILVNSNLQIRIIIRRDQ